MIENNNGMTFSIVEIDEQDLLLKRIMRDDNNDIPTLTICGSMRNAQLMEKYQAIYTLRKNVVLAPVNYGCIKQEAETIENADELNKDILSKIHKCKISRSDGIIVVVTEDMYFGEDTIKEIGFAHSIGVKVLFTHIPHKDRDKYYFNNDKTYPLYILKEEYL